MTLGSSIVIYMKLGQSTLFGKHSFKGQKPQSYTITSPAAAMTVHATLPAYHAYLGSAGYSSFTPDDFTADLKLFGQFVGGRAIADLQPGDIQQWIAQLKETMPAKTVSRKVSALGNYFRWLIAEKVLDVNPAKFVRAARVTAPLPDMLFDNECDRLLAVASKNPRTYLLVFLLLETGLKTAELFSVQIGDFDFSNKYQPELWVRHEGRQAFKDRKLKLPMQITDVFTEYVEQYKITDTLFPYSQRFISMLLIDATKQADITKKVSAGSLRDMFVVRSVKQGMKLEDIFEKIGLAKNSYDDARKKYGRLTREAL
jgi:site-specific recombinase XerD